MRMNMTVVMALVMLPMLAAAEPQRIHDEPRMDDMHEHMDEMHEHMHQGKTPCDKLKNNDKQHCDPDGTSVKPREPLPAERDGMMVPPDIPAEGLPHQNNKAAPDGDDHSSHH